MKEINKEIDTLVYGLGQSYSNNSLMRTVMNLVDNSIRDVVRTSIMSLVISSTKGGRNSVRLVLGESLKS